MKHFGSRLRTLLNTFLLFFLLLSFDSSDNNNNYNNDHSSGLFSQLKILSIPVLGGEAALIRWSQTATSPSIVYNFLDKNNWQGGKAPSSGDTASIIVGGGIYVNITVNASTAIAGLVVDSDSTCKCSSSFVFPGERSTNTECKLQLSISGSSTVLSVTGSTTLGNFSSLQLVNGATLSSPSISVNGQIKGSGTLRGDTTALASISPSSSSTSYGQIRFDGNLELTETSHLSFEAQGSSYDSIVITNHVNFLNGSYSAFIVDPTPGQSFTFIQYGSASGNIERGSPFQTHCELQSIIFGGTNHHLEITIGVEGTGSPPVQPPPDDYTQCTSKQPTGFVILIGEGGSCTPPPPQECAEGWTGANCDIPNCPGDPDCNGKGVCDAVHFATPTCVCDVGWTGKACALADCPGTPDCNSHGTCDSSGPTPVCVCSTGWNGEECNQAECPSISASLTCSGNGNCRSDLSQPKCDCSSGWTGNDCSTALDIGTCPGGCSGHGACNTTTQKCTCDEGWDFYDCSIALCNGSPNCNFKGECAGRSEAEGGNYCQCNQGWEGDNCEQGVCEKDCSGHGQCSTDSVTPQCDCNFPYIGTDCSQDETVKTEAESNKKSIADTLTEPRYITAIAIGIVVIATVVGLIVIVKRRQIMRRRSSIRARNSINEYESTNSITDYESTQSAEL